MPSYQFAPSARKRKTAKFMTRVLRELQKAYMEEKAERGLTQAHLARLLGVHRAVVCRQLAGSGNLTLRTIADYAWALRRSPEFSMSKPALPDGTNRSMAVAPVPSSNQSGTGGITPVPDPLASVDALLTRALGNARIQIVSAGSHP